MEFVCSHVYYYLFLNPNKCTLMTFARAMNEGILFKFNIGTYTLERVTKMKDLGILLHPKLIFNPYIDLAIVRAYGMLGFIRRCSKEFKGPSKQLYSTSLRIWVWSMVPRSNIFKRNFLNLSYEILVGTTATSCPRM